MSFKQDLDRILDALAQADYYQIAEARSVLLNYPGTYSRPTKELVRQVIVWLDNKWWRKDTITFPAMLAQCIVVGERVGPRYDVVRKTLPGTIRMPTHTDDAGYHYVLVAKRAYVEPGPEDSIEVHACGNVRRLYIEADKEFYKAEFLLFPVAQYKVADVLESWEVFFPPSDKQIP